MIRIKTVAKKFSSLFVRASVSSSRVSPKEEMMPIRSVTKVKTCLRLLKIVLTLHVTGSGLLEILKDAIKLLGIQDVRNLGGTESLLDQIKSFHTAALEFDLNKNGSRRQFVLRSITRNHRKLGQELEKPWNTNLTSERVDQVREKSTEVEKELMGSGGQFVFRLATPRKEKASFTCSDCSANFSSWRVYKNHVKKKHSKAVEGQGPKVTCLLPHGRGTRVTNKHSMDQICSHLQSVHKIAKPSKDHEFRGFKSFDGEKTWEPVFLLESEPDPTMDSGATSFENKAVKTREFKTTASSSTTRPSNEDGDLNLDKSEVYSMETASSSFKRKLSFNAAPSTSLSTTTCTSGEDTEDGGSTPCLKVADYEKQTGEEDGLDELFLCPNSGEKVEPELQKEREDDKKKQTGDTVLAELVFDVNSGEKIEPELEKETGIDHQVDLDWEIDDEISASYEEHLMDDENMEDPEHGDLKLDDDSDIEPEDTEEFTKQRLQTKKDRYIERRHLAPGHPANSGPNKKFIEDFVKMVIKYSKTKNEKSSTISLSTALLFRHPDSFLMYQLRSDPTFSLDKLICFKDEVNLVELCDPSPWIDEIGGDSGKLNPIREAFIKKKLKNDICHLRGGVIFYKMSSF